ncbi:TolC family protein [Methylothermus subterraneus]
MGIWLAWCVLLWGEAVGAEPDAAWTLDKVIAEVIARNPELSAGAARIAQAQTKLEEVNAAFFPRVTAGVAYTHTNDPSRAFGFIVAQRRFDFGMDINRPGFVEDFRPEVGATWSLFRGGRDWYARQAAELGIEVARLHQAELQNRLATAASQAFYALLEAPRRIAVANKTLVTVTRELERMRVRQREGTALKSDVLSLEVRLAEAQAAKIRAENAQAAARSALATLLALPAESVIDIREDSPKLPASAGAIEDWLRQALARRPEWLAAQKQIAAREKELKAAMGERWPQVDAFTVYGLNSPTPRLATSRDNWTVGVQAKIDLFSGGLLSARIREARQRLEEAKATAEHTRLAVEHEVRSAWLNLREALAQVEVARKAVASAAEALKIVQAQYRSGAATVTRFLEAETDLAAARLRLISARFAALTAKAELKRASGSWSLQEDPP